MLVPLSTGRSSRRALLVQLVHQHHNWTVLAATTSIDNVVPYRQRRFYSSSQRRPFWRKEAPSIPVSSSRWLSSSSSSSSNSRPRPTLISPRSGKDAIDDLLDRVTRNKGRPTSHEQVVDWVNETRDNFELLLSAVKQRQLDPKGKHSKGIAEWIERILRVYRFITKLSPPESTMATPMTPPPPCFDYCQEALDALTRWNLNLQPSHYEHAIAVASAEERWKEASNLFWRQIDPGAAFSPLRISVSDPKGLYAIARLGQQEQSAVAELVYDAALQLAMVSPMDQKTYVLAAGTALGKAGEWESAVEFLKSSYMAAQLGQPLVSSVMNACLLSGKFEEAMQIYDEHFYNGGEKSVAQEWQWGGNSDTLDPLVRDLVMRAVGVRDGASSLALELFDNAIQDGVTISSDALLGILKACENDRNVEGAISVFGYILDSAQRNNWIVPSSELSITDCESKEAIVLSRGTVAARWLPTMSAHMASVLRTCNANSSFGTGLFFLRRIDLLMHENSKSTAASASPRDDIETNHMLQSLLPVFTKMENGKELLVPIMVSLCGLRCYVDALRLFDHFASEDETQDEATIRDGWVIRKYAESELLKNRPPVLGNPWVSAHRHIHRLTAALHIIESSSHKLSQEEEKLILRGLAAAMQSCTSAHHPDLSLRLASYVATCIRSDSTATGEKSRLDANQSTWKELTVVNDALTGEILHALCWTNDTNGAVEIFYSVLEQKVSHLRKWRSTCSAGLSALVKLGRGEEAMKIFQELDKTVLSAECYNEIGKHSVRTKSTNELGKLYNLALNNGNLSEDLSLIAMGAVANSKMDNRVRVLRAMVDDNAKYVGTTREIWMKTRYWNVKRALDGFYARLLMWWNDAETWHLDELEFAISEFKSQKAQGLKVKNDVLRLIAINGSMFNPHVFKPNDFRWNFVPQSKERWRQLLTDVVKECGSYSISYEADFIDSVVAAFCHLEANQECVAYIVDVLDRGVRVHRRTLGRALEAANAEQSTQLVSDIHSLISDT